MHNRVRFSLVLMVVLTCAITVLAQVQNGQLTGEVTDPTGAALPNAKVTATNAGTGLATSAETNNAGTYIVRELQIGTYKVTVEHAGFKTSSKPAIEVNAGVTYRLDFKLEVGGASEVVEVTEEAAPVNTVDSKLANTVGSTQIQNLPLNGRNVFTLLQLAPGSVNVSGVLTENGEDTVVNGTRENFNGFLINGVSNKGLSGGAVNRPIEDTVAEFQLLTLNNSAQYGNSAGSVTNLVTKSGTNAYHGSGWWFVRNDVFDAKPFFNSEGGDPAESAPCNQGGTAAGDFIKCPLRFNQFGGTFGGPIIKDKLFFFLSYQGNRFRTFSDPVPVVFESPEFRQAVIAAYGPGSPLGGANGSVSSLLYDNFAPQIPGIAASAISLNQYMPCYDTNGDDVCNAADDLTGDGIPEPDSSFWLCADNNGSPTATANLINLLGVNASDQAVLTDSGCGVVPGLLAGIDRNAPFMRNGLSVSPSRLKDNLRDGNEYSARIDWNVGANDRIFAQFAYGQQNDFLGGVTGVRGFVNPTRFTFPNGQFNYIHTFSPTILNEFRAGYAGNYSKYVAQIPGVPSIYMYDGSYGFGSYNGYPQFFKEHIYSYADMVSITKGSHSLKIGADIRRNIENSEFNVGRPSYYFNDPLFFAVDAPYAITAGVNPHFDDPNYSTNPLVANLDTNVRHWRNYEYGFYFQDDWKVTRNLTLNLGIRYDLYNRHTEQNDLATTFLMGPGSGLIDDITTGAGGLHDANIPAGAPGCGPGATLADLAVRLQSVLAGVCGPGGFSPASKLGEGDHNNFGPRVGFAWDVFGNGKTSLRGGFGVSYEGTLYNPLSNSRWNPPYYSFNHAVSDQGGNPGGAPYGPQTGGGTCPQCAVAPSFTGPPDPNNFQGTNDATSTGNIQAWNPATRHQAILTGIILPEGIKDPYVYNWFFGLQRELAPKFVLELNYVGTGGRKLFRAEDINRIPGGRLPAGTCTTDIFGRNLCSQLGPFNTNGRLNPNYGRLRNWRNVVNSNYNALQASLRKQMSRGLTFTFNYTWSHSLDGGSTWHSGATTSNGAAGGEGFTTDQTLPGLDNGNSIFDIRHRIVFHYVWEMPFFKGRGGFVEAVFGGWQLNGIMSYQTGAHWQPFCSRVSRCDFNRDAVANERPNSDLSSFSGATNSMWANGFGDTFQCTNPNAGCGAGDHFSAPAAGNPGNLGRNQFLGPNFWSWDPSIFKNFKITERVGLQFRTEFFNILNRTNFQLPGANGAGQNEIRNQNFGKAGGTFNPRQLQFGLKLTF